MLPPAVEEQATEAVLNYNGSGLSILEIPHRSEAFLEILHEARLLVSKILQLNNNMEVLFLQGGATTQFAQIPYNLLDDGTAAAYCNHGVWGEKAIAAASVYGEVNIAASSADRNYTYIQKNLRLNGNERYLHLTTNNTIEGTQWHRLPDVSIPVVADMSSDIFSRRLDYNQFGFFYAGAQKNVGAAGVTLVVIDKNILPQLKRKLPSILDYREHIKAESLLNTAPVFAVYVSYLMLKWIDENGGLQAMEERAIQRANLLYRTIDSLPIFTTRVAVGDRSYMNAVFSIDEKAAEEAFILLCEQHGITNVRGHRTAGGLRASMYNAMPIEHVEQLCELMIYFSQKNG